MARGNGKVCVRPDPRVNILLYALDNKSVAWFNLVFSFLQLAPVLVNVFSFESPTFLTYFSRWY